MVIDVRIWSTDSFVSLERIQTSEPRYLDERSSNENSLYETHRILGIIFSDVSKEAF